MEETTRIFTAKITYIEQGEPENKKDKDAAAESVKNKIKSALNCDDVVVEQVQDFVLDK